jgi:hypothetical protein
MAKMFYTLEEAAAKLGKSPDDVKEMARSGQLQEFRDRDRLMFKVEQVDLMSGGGEDEGEIRLELADSGASGSAIGMSNSGISLEDDARPGDSRAGSKMATGMGRKPAPGSPGASGASGASGAGRDASDIGLADSREGTGVSVFDTGHGEEVAPGSGGGAGDQTHVGDAYGDELTLESVGSGSGLLDLTRESDDTSLGAQLLEEVYSNEDDPQIPAHASGLFEAAGAESPGNVLGDVSGGVAAMPMLVEVYDGAGSGLGVGLMVAAMIALVCVAIVAIVGVTGATPGLAMTFAGNIWMWVGILAGVTIVGGGIGYFIGKASE